MSARLEQRDAVRIVVAHRNDPHDVFRRLRGYARRGTDAPEALSLYEIRQIAFALCLYLETIQERGGPIV